METENKDKNYSDLILVDLLHLDLKNFFTRYKTDVCGLVAIILVMFLMILTLALVARIGS